MKLRFIRTLSAWEMLAVEQALNQYFARPEWQRTATPAAREQAEELKSLVMRTTQFKAYTPIGGAL